MSTIEWTIDLKKNGKTYFYEEDCCVLFDHEMVDDYSEPFVQITVLEVKNSDGFKFNTGFMGEQGITQRLFAEMVAALDADERFQAAAISEVEGEYPSLRRAS